MMPKDTNQYGTIFGGVILSLLDVAGGVEAHRQTKGRPVVTVAMNEVQFKEPVRVGELVSFYATTTRIGRTSLTVHVDVEAESYGRRVHVTSADIVYVAIDEQGRPTPVRPS